MSALEPRIADEVAPDRETQSTANRNPWTMFKKARQHRIFQDVVEQIQESILNGDLRAGEVLPPERELREQFQVSRGTLREALRVIEQKGLIEIKLGAAGGAIVRPMSSDQLSESLALLIRSQSVSLYHLAEFRQGMEGNVAALAAHRASESDVLDLKSLLRRAETILNRPNLDWQAFVRVDIQFHQAMARLSGNPVYIFVLQTIQNNIDPYYERFLPRQRETLLENYRDLEALVQAVESRQPEKARALAESHVHRFKKYMEREGREAAGAG